MQGEEIRQRGRYQAEQIGDADTNADQREHIEIARLERLPGPDEEGSAAS